MSNETGTICVVRGSFRVSRGVVDRLGFSTMSGTKPLSRNTAPAEKHVYQVVGKMRHVINKITNNAYFSLQPFSLA